jgi:hypothetical protein
MMFRELKGGKKKQLLSCCFCKEMENTKKDNKTLSFGAGGRELFTDFCFLRGSWKLISTKSEGRLYL